MYMPKTLKEAVQYYADEQVCIDTVAALRWPEGKPVCPKCGTVEGERKHYWFATQKRWKCYACRKQFSVKVDSVFEDSPLSLSIWLMAMWMLVNCKNGVSSYEIARTTGISQKAAWHLLHRIRYALGRTPQTLIGGAGQVVEADEVYLGGEPKNRHRSVRGEAIQRRMQQCGVGNRYRSTAGRGTEKIPVFGVLDRETRQVRAQVLPYVRRDVLMEAILSNVEKRSRIHTDGLRDYRSLKALDFVHETVDHIREYVRGDVHTNGIENFWSLLKRGLKGTYVAVEPFHLDKYLDEQIFRFNNRATKDNPLNDTDRFALALSQIAGKRLQFKELTGKVSGSC